MIQVWWVKGRSLELNASTVIYRLYNSSTSLWEGITFSGITEVLDDVYDDFINSVSGSSTNGLYGYNSWYNNRHVTILGDSVVSAPYTKFKFTTTAEGSYFAKEIGFKAGVEYTIPTDGDILVAPNWGLSRLVIGTETRLETDDRIPIGNEQFVKPANIDEYGANAGGDVFKAYGVFLKKEYELTINSYETSDMWEAFAFFTYLKSGEIVTMRPELFSMLDVFDNIDAQLYPIAPFPEKATQLNRYKIHFVRVEKI